MDKTLQLKTLALVLYAVISIVFFYDANFVQNSPFVQEPHVYGNGAFMLAVLSLGVVLSALVYNLAFYFYIRNRQYLYYALTQFFVLLSLLSLEALLIEPFTKMYGFGSFYLLDVSQALMLVFSLLFIQEFFQIARVNAVIKVLVYLALFDLFLSLFLGHTLLTKFVPTVLWVWFVLSEVYRHSEKKDVPFYFVMVGWHSVIVTLLFELTYVIDPTGFDFPFLHLAFALESMLLSFALSYKFKLIDDAQKVQQSLLLQQSRLASMGEMISIIAHQWRQPLNFLSYSLMHIKRNCKNDEASLQSIKEANEQLQYMSQTIEHFRNFYNPSKKRESFSIKASCQNILKILTPTLTPLKIEIALRVKVNFEFFANSNEFEQVILNIVNNAKDAFVSKDIAKPMIEIVIDQSTITIADNAGGIRSEDREKIFEPYFSTKENSDGIGLYIAKTIVENEMGGVLLVRFIDGGSEFIIKL